GRKRGARVRPAPAGVAGARPDCAGSRQRQRLRPRLLDLARDALRLEAWLLARLPARLGLESRSLRLEPRRLYLCQRLLGLSPARARPAVRPGPHRAHRTGPALDLRAELLRAVGLPPDGAVRAAVAPPLLLRRLFRA